MCNPHLFTPFMVWKGLFQHLEVLPMDDYNFESMCSHDIHIAELWLYWSPNYVSIINGLMVLVATTTISTNTNSINGSGSVKSRGFIGGNGTTGNGGTRPSPTHGIHCLHLT